MRAGIRATVGPVALTFAASACVMALEIVAGRIAARHVGNSIYTWTSIIAAVLAGISIGNLLGGWAVDRFARSGSRRLAGTFLAIAAILSVAVIWTHSAAFGFVLDTGWSFPSKVLVGVTLTFLPPSVVLGALSPVLASWVLQASEQRGSALGSVYAAGASGSILGTLLAGFVLIPTLGTSTIVAAIAFLLAVLSVLLWRSVFTMGTAAVVAAGILVAGLPRGLNGWLDGVLPGNSLPTDTVHFSESAYQAITVRYDDGEYVLVMDDLIHGHYDLRDPERLTYYYLRVYRDLLNGTLPMPGSARSLHLGAGAYTFPRYVDAVRPRDTVTVVEIDPEVTAVNQAVLGLDDPLPFEVLHLDARRAVLELGEVGRRFDAVFLDAFQGFAVPHHLGTQEYFTDLLALLSPRGFVAANVIDVFGEGKVLSSIYNTVADVFDNSYVIATSADGPAPDRATYVVVGSMAPLDQDVLTELQTSGFYVLQEAELLALGDVTDGLILTDEYAPLDSFVAQWLR